jgi:uncharacterized protein
MMRFLTTLLFLLISGLAKAQAPSFQVPSLQGPVMDLAHVMSQQDQDILEGWIREFHSLGKGQLQVLTLPNLGGLSIEEASIRITDKWKIGDAKRDDGVLLLVAMQEHRLRIEVGQGLEGTLPDIRAKQIVSDVMTPFFRQGQASQGILQGAREILREIDPQFQPSNDVEYAPPQKSHRSSPLKQYEGLIFLVFIILVILRNLFLPRSSRGRSFWGGGGGGWGGGGFGGFGGGSGGGGGWSGGGGGFSGGGASGSW